MRGVLFLPDKTDLIFFFSSSVSAPLLLHGGVVLSEGCSLEPSTDDGASWGDLIVACTLDVAVVAACPLDDVAADWCVTCCAADWTCVCPCCC